jgi:pyruvate dehydrogenase E1 component alpha subunit
LPTPSNIKKENHVSVAGVGDGATSEGDFNEALNFAAVFQVPAIFVVQNNGYAISVPRHKQTAIRNFTERAAGFGVPASLVDGNDILAVYSAMTTAIDRARNGGGPTLIEALTYRLGAHTTADDPTKYRPPEELAYWSRRDPLLRYRQFLTDHGLLTSRLDEQLHDEAAAEFEAGLKVYEALPPQETAQQFELTFANPTPQLLRQRDQLLQDLN